MTSRNKLSKYLISSCIFVALVLVVKSKSENKTPSWDFLVYTQDWPPATCYDPKVQKCVLAENSTIWTIHGLWPDRNDGKDVSFCNNSWTFNETELEPVMDEMKLKWPSLVGTKGSLSFWSHEWEKHGTCAAEDLKFDSIIKYFSAALKLHDQYNMAILMKKAGFVPNTRTILETSDVLKQLALVVGKNVSIECSNVDKAPTSALSVVELFFDRNLELIDSDKPGNLDCKKSLVYWPFTSEKINDEL